MGLIIIKNTLVSEDLGRVKFACDPARCKGMCCIEGDAGAPLEYDEIALLGDDIENIKPFMRQEGIRAIASQGVFDYDEHGHYVTPLVNGRECVYVYFDAGIARCAIEAAFNKGKTGFRKPLSCHLYPVRISRDKHFERVHYHRWQVCGTALENGHACNIALYDFLQEPLTRKYGKQWYRRLVACFTPAGGKRKKNK
jgi:hypothetical protein